MLTIKQLKQIVPYARKLDKYIAPLNSAMLEHQITTPARQSAFLAQIIHESGSFQYVREIASGAAYEWRKDLGNTQAGDGVKYKGRGLIQITGRANYQSCSMALFGDARLLDQPELLEQPQPACLSAAWFWHKNGLNELADKAEFKLITKRINGGYNGLAERTEYYRRAAEVLVCSAIGLTSKTQDS